MEKILNFEDVTFVLDDTRGENPLVQTVSDADVAKIAAMSAAAKDNLKHLINQFNLKNILPIDKQGRGFICPVCGNGSGNTGDGIVPTLTTDKDGNNCYVYHCFKCNDFEGDLYKLIVKFNRLSAKDFPRILAIGQKIMASKPAAETLSTAANVKREYSAADLKMFQNDIHAAQNSLDELPENDMRGLTLDTYRHFHCGYLSDWGHPSLRGKSIVSPTPRIIIPTGEHSYNAILLNSARKSTPQKYWKMNAGTKEIFNLESVSAEHINIIVEGEIDAMSIYQAGYENVVALGGTGNYRKLLALLHAKNPAEYQFVVLFDNDSAGRQETEKLKETLIKAGFKATADFLSADTVKVDANDILINQGAVALNDLINNIITNARERLKDVTVQPSTPPANNSVNVIFGDSRDFKIPKGYHMTRNYISVDVKDTQRVISAAPFYISAVYRRLNVGGDDTYFADITTVNNGFVKTIKQIPRGDLADSRRLSPLSNLGLPFTSSNSKILVDFIDSFVAANREILREIDLHSKLGWIDDNQTFVSPYSDQFVIDKNNSLAQHLRVHGKYGDWLALLKCVYQESPVGRFIVSAGLASLILPIIGCRPFVLYLRSQSKAGKSAAFKLAASTFGDADILKSLNSTVNSLEGVIADISPFPAIFDERQVAGINFDVNNFVYRAGSGQGRGRCNTDGTIKDVKRWKNVTICNGEESLTENAKTQGIHTRTLELDFDGDKIMRDELAQDIHLDFDSGKSFGHGAKIFLEKLQFENLDDLSEMYKSFSRTLKDAHARYIAEHCRYIAAVSVADFLALKYFFDFSLSGAVESAYQNADRIIRYLQSETELSDVEREKDFILNWVSGERLHFDGLQKYSEKLVTPIYGCTDADGLLINISYLKEACIRAGISYAKLKGDLINAGVFEKINGEDTAQKWIGAKCRVVKLSDDYVKNHC